jgi:hypothetical protein
MKQASSVTLHLQNITTTTNGSRLHCMVEQYSRCTMPRTSALTDYLPNLIVHYLHVSTWPRVCSIDRTRTFCLPRLLRPRLFHRSLDCSLCLLIPHMSEFPVNILHHDLFVWVIMRTQQHSARRLVRLLLFSGHQLHCKRLHGGSNKGVVVNWFE